MLLIISVILIFHQIGQFGCTKAESLLHDSDFQEGKQLKRYPGQLQGDHEPAEQRVALQIVTTESANNLEPDDQYMSNQVMMSTSNDGPGSSVNPINNQAQSKQPSLNRVATSSSNRELNPNSIISFDDQFADLDYQLRKHHEPNLKTKSGENNKQLELSNGAKVNIIQDDGLSSQQSNSMTDKKQLGSKRIIINLNNGLQNGLNSTTTKVTIGFADDSPKNEHSQTLIAKQTKNQKQSSQQQQQQQSMQKPSIMNAIKNQGGIPTMIVDDLNEAMRDRRGEISSPMPKMMLNSGMLQQTKNPDARYTQGNSLNQNDDRRNHGQQVAFDNGQLTSAREFMSNSYGLNPYFDQNVAFATSYPITATNEPNVPQSPMQPHRYPAREPIRSWLPFASGSEQYQNYGLPNQYNTREHVGLLHHQNQPVWPMPNRHIETGDFDEFSKVVQFASNPRENQDYAHNGRVATSQSAQNIQNVGLQNNMKDKISSINDHESGSINNNSHKPAEPKFQQQQPTQISVKTNSQHQKRELNQQQSADKQQKHQANDIVSSKSRINSINQPKMDERVASLLERLKLYTTRDHLLKVARDLEKYPSAKEQQESEMTYDQANLISQPSKVVSQYKRQIKNVVNGRNDQRKQIPSPIQNQNVLNKQTDIMMTNSLDKSINNKDNNKQQSDSIKPSLQQQKQIIYYDYSKDNINELDDKAGNLHQQNGSKDQKEIDSNRVEHDLSSKSSGSDEPNENVFPRSPVNYAPEFNASQHKNDLDHVNDNSDDTMTGNYNNRMDISQSHKDQLISSNIQTDDSEEKSNKYDDLISNHDHINNDQSSSARTGNDVYTEIDGDVEHEQNISNNDHSTSSLDDDDNNEQNEPVSATSNYEDKIPRPSKSYKAPINAKDNLSKQRDDYDERENREVDVLEQIIDELVRREHDGSQQD